jgi:hypothetical protein
MSEEISVGVRIIVERCKTNPDEMTEEYGKWGQLRNAVFDTVENKLRGSAWLRGLTDEEITMLYEAFSSLHRKVFDDYVMKQVLGTDEEKEEYVGQAKLNKAMAQRGLLMNNPYQNTIQPGQIVPIATTQTSNTSITTTLKNALGIK